VTLRGSGGQDYYDVSLVDGFNVPMQVSDKLRGVRFEVLAVMSVRIAVFWNVAPSQR
jgi:hypothetical protein